MPEYIWFPFVCLIPSLAQFLSVVVIVSLGVFETSTPSTLGLNFLELRLPPDTPHHGVAGAKVTGFTVPRLLEAAPLRPRGRCRAFMPLPRDSPMAPPALKASNPEVERRRAQLEEELLTPKA